MNFLMVIMASDIAHGHVRMTATATATATAGVVSERVVQARALDGISVLCSWARHFTLTVPLSTQVYKWVPANC